MSLPPRRHRPDDEDGEAWLMTYADMVTLLLCFFIIMFAMSEPDGTKFKKVSQALREYGFYNDMMVTEDPYEKLRETMAMSLGASGYDQFIVVAEKKGRVEVELSSSAFFERGSAKFTPAALPMMELVAQQIEPLATRDVIIEVEGHTDDTPIATTQYPSNWELSGARAANVVRYLIAKGFPPQKLRAVAKAETEPKAPNRDARGNALPVNQDLNRRVLIKMLKGRSY